MTPEPHAQAARPFPRSTRPLPGESLYSYLLTQSSLLAVSPGDLVRTWTTQATPYLPMRAAFDLTPLETQRAAHQSRLEPHAITRLTLRPYVAMLTADLGPDSVRRMGTSPDLQSWIDPRHWVFCPDCLRQTGGLWPLWWLTPWAFACLQHQRLLSDRCPHCQTPVGAARNGLISLPGHILEPTQCRSGLGTKPCGYDLASKDSSIKPKMPRDALAAQEWLERCARSFFEEDAATSGDPTTFRSLGLPVGRAAHLRDIRTIMIATRIGSSHHARSTLPRTLLQRPPLSPSTRSTLAISACQILTAPTRDAGTQRLRTLDQAADSIAHDLYARSKFRTHPSVAVKAVISARAQAVVSVASVRPLLLAANPNTIDITNIPPYLTDDIFREHLKPLSGSTQRFLRRGAAILIAQHVGNLPAPDAAMALGYTAKTPHTVLPRLGYDLTAIDKQHDFQAAVGRIYEALQYGPIIDYRRRREALSTWRLSVDEAATLREGARVTKPRYDDFHERWAAAATLWIWAIVTAADPSTHPLIQHTRKSTPTDKDRRPLPQLRGLRLRATPATTASIRRYAESVSCALDSGKLPTPPTPSPTPPLQRRPRPTGPPRGSTSP